MDVWHWTPFVTLTLLAGLLAIPKEPIEAASVDGANRVQMYRYLILPMLLPVILITVFYTSYGFTKKHGRCLYVNKWWSR